MDSFTSLGYVSWNTWASAGDAKIEKEGVVSPTPAVERLD